MEVELSNNLIGLVIQADLQVLLYFSTIPPSSVNLHCCQTGHTRTSKFVVHSVLSWIWMSSWFHLSLKTELIHFKEHCTPKMKLPLSVVQNVFRTELVSWKLGWEFNMWSFVTYSAEFNAKLHRCHFAAQFSPSVFSHCKGLASMHSFFIQHPCCAHIQLLKRSHDIIWLWIGHFALMKCSSAWFLSSFMDYLLVCCLICSTKETGQLGYWRVPIKLPQSLQLERSATGPQMKQRPHSELGQHDKQNLEVLVWLI